MPLNNYAVKKINAVIDWSLHMLGNIIVFILLKSIFDSIYVDENNIILYSSIIVLLLAILNKTIKPILVKLTIPITGITFGLFYPCINLIILKLVDWILGRHFQLNNIFMALFFAINLSVVNLIAEIIIKNIIKRVKVYE